MKLPQLKLFSKKPPVTPPASGSTPTPLKTADPKTVTPPEPVTAEEVVNKLDPEIEVHVESVEARLQNQMSTEMDNVHHREFLTLKLNLQKILLILGLILLVMWLTPVVKTLTSHSFTDKLSGVFHRSTKPSPSAYVLRIRIKGDKEARVKMASMAATLKVAGYTSIDEQIVESMTDTAGVYVKSSQQTAANTALALIKEQLAETATQSADLDTESDVDVVINLK